MSRGTPTSVKEQGAAGLMDVLMLHVRFPAYHVGHSDFVQGR